MPNDGMEKRQVVGRFAPSPSGRMHLGNVFAALLSWLSVRSCGGKMILRMEDLDPERTNGEYARLIREDLTWLGLDWDEETEPQSRRGAVYDRYFDCLRERGLLYPCYCTRARLHGANAPHGSEGQWIYDGRCRNLTREEQAAFHRAPSWRVRVPDQEYGLLDGVFGLYRENLQKDCGDFVVRRADGVYAYQLAVTVDDGEAGVTQVVRGGDLLSSAPRQMYLQDLFGFPHPDYFHVPMLLAPEGRRLSKRDGDLDMGALREKYKPEALLGFLAFCAGLLPRWEPVSARELADLFSWEKISRQPIYMDGIL